MSYRNGAMYPSRTPPDTLLCSTAHNPPAPDDISSLSLFVVRAGKLTEIVSTQVYEQRPFAFLQIILAIFAVEVYGNRKQQESPMGGDLGFDPLGLKPAGDEAWERVQLRELKNGRLAMFAILGMIVQENLTGVGVLEPIDAFKGLV